MTRRPYRLWAYFLVFLSAPAHSDFNSPELFGYKLGQRLEVTEVIERRMYGVVVADPAGLTEGLEELLLTVTPKTHTIVSISGSVSFDDAEQIKGMEDQYWEILKVQFEGWERQRLGIGPIIFWKSPFAVRVSTSRTRTEGIFEFSVRLDYSPASPERRALEALRRKEARQVIADKLSGS